MATIRHRWASIPRSFSCDSVMMLRSGTMLSHSTCLGHGPTYLGHRPTCQVMSQLVSVILDKLLSHSGWVTGQLVSIILVKLLGHSGSVTSNFVSVTKLGLDISSSVTILDLG
ncbi:hypothetical protein Lalb_Chr09g0330651 [Lupinus albus]|uniref:Uncharacterized protein n=1 Tax=Lupinus albus TaxID=3870 RepID=A0A6A4Q0A3_LUPAL|nr:hypothetical protein Lalb_Chr09g0330651 [Lupinus albus]